MRFKYMLRYVVIVMIVFCSTLWGQGNAPEPRSWNYGLESPQYIDLAGLDLSSVLAHDLIADQDKSMPWRYGIERLVSVDIFTHGQWTELADGTRIWRVALRSPGALNLSLNFSDFYIPQGGQVQFYNATQTDWSKVHHANATASREFGTWIIEGDEIVIEYLAQPDTTELPRLHVESLIHGYRMGAVNQLIQNQNEFKGLEDSGDCHYDVNCGVGESFDGHRNQLKKAVALLNLGNGYLCSAVLINNAKEDKTPYILTANHCLENSNPAYWSMRFNWISPDPVCGSADSSIDIGTNFTVNGAELRARNARSDFALVELNEPIPAAWDVAFAGWDRTDDLPEYQIGIHHPQGDVMKICRDDDPMARDTANGTQVWLIKGTDVGGSNGWDLGTTEGGSSGSPLFNPQGQIIGQLHGGMASCDGLQSNGRYDLYGRFASSWSLGSSPEDRLSDWLDPDGLGIEKLGTLENALSIGDFDLEGQVAVYPNPARDRIFIQNTKYPRLNGNVFALTGQSLISMDLSATENQIDVSQLAPGIYLLYLEDMDSGNVVTKKLQIQP